MNGLNGDERLNDPYMAFIDGSLDYRCSACPDNCCRGIGFGGMEQGAIGALIDNHPELLPWIQFREHDFTMLGTPRSGCFFLENNGLCRIELASGRSAKPGLCIMFPFNRLERIGDHLVVRPFFRCSQLEAVVPRRPGSVAGSHSAILRDLHATGMAERRLPQIPIPSTADPDMILAREREWLATCGNALGQRRAVDVLADLSEDAAGSSDFVRHAVKLLGLDKPQKNRPRDGFDDMLSVLSPAVRLDHLTLPPEGLVHAMLLAEALVRNGFVRSAAPPTIVDVASFLDVARPILAVLACGEEPFQPLVDWQSDGTRPPLDGPDQKMAFGAMVILTGKGYGTLRALEEALSGVPRPLERVLFIRRLSALLSHMPSATRRKEEGKQWNRSSLQ